MGAWSVDVFGGDGPLDILYDIGQLIGDDELYPIEHHTNKEQVRVLLEQNEVSLRDMASKWDEPKDFYPVWAAVVMSVGGNLSDYLRENAVVSAQQLAISATEDGWDDIQSRAAYMNNLADIIQNYKTGDIVNFEHKGLFELIAEGFCNN